MAKETAATARHDPLAFCAEELAALDAASLRRSIRSLDSAQEPEVTFDGRRVLLLASNNYLGLATHPKVVQAAIDAARTWGAGTGSARLITGANRLHEELETAIAELKGTEDAVLFSSGYLANIGALSALASTGDAIFSDELNHASIIDGARLSRAEVFVYRHADAGHCNDLLSKWRAKNPRRRALVVTDSIFSMDGDLAPLKELVDFCEHAEAMLMIDEAHATGVVGPGGRGAAALLGLEKRIPIVMGTLSKALGSAGGFIAGRRELCDFLRNTARAFIFDTAMPPPTTAAALAAIRVIAAEPERTERVHVLAARLAGGLYAHDFHVASPAAAVVPVMVGESVVALDLARALLDAGVLVPAIRPPTVPAGTARLRATVMATHTEEQIDRAIEAFVLARSCALANPTAS